MFHTGVTGTAPENCRAIGTSRSLPWALPALSLFLSHRIDDSPACGKGVTDNTVADRFHAAPFQDEKGVKSLLICTSDDPAR